jgi:hypothetical protein
MKPHHDAKLVKGDKLLEILFDKSCRPSMQWLNTQRKSGRIPSCKMGRFIYYDPGMVYAAMFERPAPQDPCPPECH